MLPLLHSSGKYLPSGLHVDSFIGGQKKGYIIRMVEKSCSKPEPRPGPITRQAAINYALGKTFPDCT